MRWGFGAAEQEDEIPKGNQILLIFILFKKIETKIKIETM